MKQTAKQRFIYDLLQQANELAWKDPKRPKQANIRRAISTTYYAVFHHLIEVGTRLLFSNANNSENARYIAERKFSHKTIKEASSTYYHFNGKPIRELFGHQQDERLFRLSEILIELQQLRHWADYNTREDLLREHALLSLSHAKLAIDIIEEIKRTNNKAFQTFAALLLFGKSRGS